MDQCLFCKIAQKEIPGKYIYEDEDCVAFLDLSQATRGHTLVVPKTHVTNILDADPQLAAHLFQVTTQLAQKITFALQAKGCNILSNAGEVAGQTVMHFHIHIIPRYELNDGFTLTLEDHQGKYNLDEIQKTITEA